MKSDSRFIETLRTLKSDIKYILAERRQFKSFAEDIRTGVARPEPRFREITDLNLEWPAGTIEYAHISRYFFAAKFCTGRVLNAACGCGYGNEILSQSGAYVVGVDLFEQPLLLARKHFNFGAYVRGDLMRLSLFQDETFDSVVSFETIEHVSNPIKVCTELKRVLKKGGVFVGSIPIMIFHNPGSNFTFRRAFHLIRDHFTDAELYMQDNYEILPFSQDVWRSMRGKADKFLLWTWRRP